MGVTAVSNAVMALAHARFYLLPSGLDVRSFPEWVMVVKDGFKVHELRLAVVLQQMAPQSV